jgi:glutathione-regulated potassium-efflux system ancillary protein KefG
MPRVLIQFAHPALEGSRVHRRLLAQLPEREGLTVNDLYEAYPDFDVDVAREQALLVAHDIIVFQHPFFWYSTPPLLKQWEDLVLEHGWAYGRQGRALRGKQLLHVISAGGREEAYQHEGYNRFTVGELLAPLEQTAHLCGMRWTPPYMIHGTHRMTEPQIDEAAQRFRSMVAGLCDGRIDLGRVTGHPTLNHAIEAADAEAGQ